MRIHRVKSLALSQIESARAIEGWDEYADWASAQDEWLAQFLTLAEDGSTPSADTLRRVFCRLNPSAFQEAFQSWTRKLHDATLATDADTWQTLAIDGKALRRAFRRSGINTNLTLVSAFSTANQLVLGQVRAETKCNEITAIPKLLELLSLNGALVTIDAAGTQTNIAQQIVDANGDYVLALKGNQGKTFTETRTVKGQKPPHTRSFYLCSLEYKSIDRIAHAIRAHWGIENRLHWCLDVRFREAESQIGEGFAPENLAMIRKFARQCFKRRTDSK